MAKRLAVLGTGTIGSSIGADLTRAGERVVLIDQWPAHVEAMKARGLRVVMPDREEITRVDAIHLCEVCSRREPFDIVFLTAKSYDTCWMVQFIKPCLSPDGVLVSLQNSLNDEWIAPLIGYERDVAAVIELSGELMEPGIVKRNTAPEKTWFALGELHGRVTSRVQEIAGILGPAGKAEVTSNIWGAKWSKLAVNSMSQGIAGLLDIPDWEISQNPELLGLAVGLGRECLEVGTTLGYRVEPIFGMTAEAFLGAPDDVLKGALLTLFSHIGKKARNSVLQDHLKGRRSEIPFLNGLVVRKGREAHVPTPLNQGIVSLTDRIEKEGLKPGPANLPLLERMVRGTPA
jgi:2-dehydropantoate 2-reductase